MKITPQDINTQEFKRSLRGYDMDEVDAFLQQVADELETSVQENLHLKDKLKDMEEKLVDYKKRDEELEKLLLTAQKMTEGMKDVARREADAAAIQAKGEAQKIVAEAHKQLVRFQSQVDELRRYRDGFVIQFKSFLDQQYRMLGDFAKGGTSAPAPPAAAAPPRAAAPAARAPSGPPPAKAAPPPAAAGLEIEVVGADEEEPVG